MARRSSANDSISLPLVFDLPEAANSAEPLVKPEKPSSSPELNHTVDAPHAIKTVKQSQQISQGNRQQIADSRCLNVAPQKLWLCLQLPQFALEIFSDNAILNDINAEQKKIKETTAQVVIYEQTGQWRVSIASAYAKQAGIEKGMALTAAYALCPDLKTLKHDDEQQLTILKLIADWAYQFTPVVSLVSGNALVLEIYHSLTLFGGLPAMLQKINRSFAGCWSYQLHYSVAPTAKAAYLLVQFPGVTIIEDRLTLRSTLATMTVADAFANEPRLFKKLNNLGLNTLQDLWRLPREGLARRYGKAVLQRLDKLLGDDPDPLPLHQPPVSFDANIELPIESTSLKMISLAAEKLMLQLQQFLKKRDAGITRFFIRFYFFDYPPQNINLSLRQCSRDATHILGLLDERIERLALAGPVSEVRLIVKEIIPFVAQPQALFSLAVLEKKSEKNTQSTDPDWDTLLEQIQNRLGKSAVQYLQLLDDHRPEYAWRYQRQFEQQNIYQSPVNSRPLWLLFSPQRLFLRQNRLWYGGFLSILSGPERIDSGWYSEQRVARDYYMASDNNGRRLWIFRDLKSKHWYLHGCF